MKQGRNYFQSANINRLKYDTPGEKMRSSLFHSRVHQSYKSQNDRNGPAVNTENDLFQRQKMNRDIMKMRRNLYEQ